MKRIITLLLVLLISTPVFAADITWSVTTPSGTVEWTSPELDVTAPNATSTHWERLIAWTCDAYTLTDDNGTPEDPADDTVIPCDTNAQKAQHLRAWMQGQWRGTKANVLRWEDSQGIEDLRANQPDLE